MQEGQYFYAFDPCEFVQGNSFELPVDGGIDDDQVSEVLLVLCHPHRQVAVE